jgi:putative ABC transport system permease protein
LIRQLLTECLLFSLLGAALGSLLAYVSIRYFRAASPIELPPGNAVTVNLRVLAFSGGLAVLTTLLFGLVPAFKSSGFDLNQVLKVSGRTLTRGALSHRVGKLLVIAEVTLSFVLLVGAGLLIRSVVALGDAPLGFRLDHMLTGRVNLPADPYQNAEERLAFYDRMTSALSALPGVEGVALTSALPLTGPGSSALNIQGRQSQQPPVMVGDVGIRVVSPGYLALLDIPLLRGRHFDTGDRKDSQQVAIVNESLVQRYFPGEDPIGKLIKVGRSDQTNPWLTIVGIVGNVKEATVYKEMDYVVAPFVYRPVSQAADRSLAFAIRTTASPGVLAGAIESAVSDIDPDVPVSDVQAMQERVTTFLSQARFRAMLLGVFSVVALLLASIGIYGVLSQSVLQRTNEIGIRTALGAQPRDILRQVIGQGMLLALIGVAMGLIVAVAMARFLKGLLYGVGATDPLTLIVIALLLTIVALVACYLPARRATKIDPMVALRYE